MIFKHTNEDVIHLNDLTIPLDVFLDLEPSYTLPENTSSRYYEPKVKHFIVTDNGLKNLPLEWGYGNNILNRVEEFENYMGQVKEYL